MEDKKNKIIKIVRNSGIILLLVITSIITITNILYFFKIEITKWHLPFIYLLTNIIFILIYKKKNKIINLLISSMIAILVFAGAITFSGNLYDLSVDGNFYHKLAIGSLKNGWNPVYENNEDFNKEQGNAIDIEQGSGVLWTDHYTKGNWTFSAVIYSFTENIESGKCITILLMYICFTLIMSYLSKKINLIFSIIIGLLLVINPITIVQATNYYIDGDLGLSLFIILYALIAITDKNCIDSKFEKFMILACSLIICINVKFTGLAFAGIFCLLFYIYWLYNSKKDSKEQFIKNIKFYTIFYIITVLISVCIVGYSSYVRNTIEHKNPLYPLFGKDKADIITTMQPNYFSQRNVIQKFMISIFSKGENVTYSYERDDIKPTIKVPFTFTKQELSNYNIPDIRIGGFGPWFSGILIISVIITIYAYYDMIKNKRKNIIVPYSLILLGIVILLFIIDGNWWARYTPYLYLVPIFSLIYLVKDKNDKIKFLIGCILGITMIINSLMILSVNIKNYENNGAYVENKLNMFEKYSIDKDVVKIKLTDYIYQGALYNLCDKNINFELDDKIEGKNEGYFFTY